MGGTFSTTSVDMARWISILGIRFAVDRLAVITVSVFATWTVGALWEVGV